MRSETSFELDGDLIVVDAIAVGPSGQAEVRLVLDTGAVVTTLTPTIAESIGYTSAARVARSVMRTAAVEHGYIVRLVQLSTKVVQGGKGQFPTGACADGAPAGEPCTAV